MTAPASDRPAPRPLAPLWARAVLACALASVAARQTVGADAREWLAGGLLLIAALSCVGALAWPDFSWRRAGAIALGAALGCAIGARTVWTTIPLSPGTSSADRWRLAGAWAALLAGAAAALLSRAGDPARPSLRRRAALALGGALATAIVAGLAWCGARAGVRAVDSLGPLGAEITAGLLGAGLALGVEAGARLSRRMGPATALALIVAAYGVLGLSRGTFRGDPAIRMDTSDIRFYLFGLPSVPYETMRVPEPAHARLLDVARAAPALVAPWRLCDYADLYLARRRYLDDKGSVAAWAAREPRVARFLMEDLAAGADPEDDARLQRVLARGPAYGWRDEAEIKEYCRAHGFDPFAHDAGVDPTPEALTARLRDGVFDERARAAARLGRAFPLAAQPALVAALDDPAPEVRIAAATALGAMLDPSLLPALRAARSREEAAARGDGPPRDPESARVEGDTLPAFDAAIGRVAELRSP